MKLKTDGIVLKDRVVRGLAVFSAFSLIGPLFVLLGGGVMLGQDWRSASRDSAAIAPVAKDHPEALVQVYAARTFGWRGAFGVHSWIATKEKEALQYTVFEVIGWRALHGEPVVVAHEDVPDRLWFGHRPEIIAEKRGREAEALIPQIRAAVSRYPYAQTYQMWPGPNSNTFTAFVARQVPGLGLNLPPTAIGKDYLDPDTLLAPTPSGTGKQVSLAGLIGISLAEKEGLEINLLGLSFGVEPWPLTLRWPGLGRLGWGKE